MYIDFILQSFFVNDHTTLNTPAWILSDYQIEWTAALGTLRVVGFNFIQHLFTCIR